MLVLSTIALMAASSPAIYAPADAVADVLAEPLKHVGTGTWPGIFQIQSCAYGNSRVLVVDVYCTTKEKHLLDRRFPSHPARTRAR